MQALLAATIFLSVQVGAIVFLQAGGVLQHDGGEIRRGTRHVHIPAKLVLAEDGKRAGMVYMRVREEYGLNRARIKSQEPVLPIGLLPLALKKAAVQQDSAAGHFEQMTAAGD
ncbi:MAG: hypothetical protein NTNFB01_28540 [Nitrospira sp.]